MSFNVSNINGNKSASSVDRINNYLNVMLALMLRDMRTRFAGSYWGYLVQVLWPVVHMFIIAGAMAFRNVPSPTGGGVLVFAASGAVPALCFQYISREMMKGIISNKPLTYYPQVKTLDVMFSRVMVEIVSSFIGIFIILSILYSIGEDPFPKDIPTAIAGYLAAICFGISIGTINCAIVSFFPQWVMGYILISILLYLSSGVVFVPSDFPEQVYSILKWNPVLQIVEWVRLGYEPGSSIKIDYIYIFLWVFITLSIGFFVEKTIGRRNGI